eukprot:1679064-Pyramimonas_sp.AAC.1
MAPLLAAKTLRVLARLLPQASCDLSMNCVKERIQARVVWVVYPIIAFWVCPAVWVARLPANLAHADGEGAHGSSGRAPLRFGSHLGHLAEDSLPSEPRARMVRRLMHPEGEPLRDLASRIEGERVLLDIDVGHDGR